MPTNIEIITRFELAFRANDQATIDELCDPGLVDHNIGHDLDGTLAAFNARNQLAVVDLADDGSGGTVQAIMTCEAFAFPTAVAVAGDRLLVVNGQLDALGGTPRLPFTVAVVAAPDASARRPEARS